PQYMSTEQATGREVDGRSDLYSLGVVLFEMLAGRVPYKGESAIATLSMHATMPIPSVRDFNPDVTLEIDDVVRKALSKEAAERFQTGSLMAGALEAAISAPDRALMAPTVMMPTLTGGDTSASQSQGTFTPTPVDLDTLYQQLLGLTRQHDWRSAV